MFFVLSYTSKFQDDQNLYLWNIPQVTPALKVLLKFTWLLGVTALITIVRENYKPTVARQKIIVITIITIAGNMVIILSITFYPPN